MLLLRTRFEPIVLAVFVLAFGVTAGVLWELGEYLTFIRTNEEEFATAYTDTLGDLTLDLVGTLAAATTTYLVARRSRTVPSQTPVSATSTASASRN